MPKHRTPLPPELKELIQLIRHGHLFEVQQWIRDGKPIRLPTEGHFILSPMQAAIRTGFHTMVEVMLEAMSKDENMDDLLHEAVRMNRLDLIQLIHRYGANPKSMCYDCVASTQNPLILRWFEDHGIDLVTDHPLAAAFQSRVRAALGTYMRWRKRIPELKHQADIALRYHAAEGSLKWVCLLLWAGADPRAVVPRLDTKKGYDDDGTALEEAVSRDHVEIVEKFKIDPARDDLDFLLMRAGVSANKTLVTQLLELGANPNGGGELSAVDRYMWSLEWSLENDRPFGTDYHVITDILGMMAAKGAKWQPRERDNFRNFRTALARANPSDAINTLEKLLQCGFLTEEIFRELMATPRMKELLGVGRPGVIHLRKLAGFADPARPRGRRAKLKSAG
jgi:hypothetical protein